jgi:hypothetical protein
MVRRDKASIFSEWEKGTSEIIYNNLAYPLFRAAKVLPLSDQFRR